VLLWDNIRFSSLGFQAVAGVTGMFSLAWIPARTKNTEMGLEKLKRPKIPGEIALGLFTLGAVLLLCYEIHLLQIG
jgi:hypothetical protein